MESGTLAGLCGRTSGWSSNDGMLKKSGRRTRKGAEELMGFLDPLTETLLNYAMVVSWVFRWFWGSKAFMRGGW